MDDFHNSLLDVDIKHWDCILDAVGLQTEHCAEHVGLDNPNLSSLSAAYQGGLVGFSSTVKG